jgi:hypothetical protein
MIGYFLLGIGLAGLIGFGLKAFADADPRALRRVLVTLGGVLGLGLTGYLLASGRGGMLLGLLFFLYPLWRNWRAVAARAKATLGPTPGQVSGAETAWLRIQLAHDTGAMTGEVLQGAFAGRSLDSLGLPELEALHRACAADSDSRRLLEAYLDRRFGADWRAADGGSEAEADAAPGAGEGQAASPGGMSREEAWAVLGLEPGAAEDAIRAAHKRLMVKIHPDQGGSDWLAARINQAKDLLLKRGNRSA